MANYVRPGYWRCDKNTGKRKEWVGPQPIQSKNQPMRGVGRGGNHAHHDLVLLDNLAQKGRA